MPADQSPLLAPENESSRPWLSNGPLIPEDSSFSRLISQTNPSSALNFASLRQPASSAAIVEPSYCAMTASTSLYTIFVGFLLASFVTTDAWQETVLQVTVGSFKPANIVLQSRSLATLLQDSNNFTAMLIMWMSYFVIPLLFMVVMPLWMVHDFSRTWLASDVQSRARLRIEQLAKAALIMIWIQAVQNVALTGITIQTSTGELLVRNRSGAGWTTFCVGMSCCLAALCVLRYIQHRKSDGFVAWNENLHQYAPVASQAPTSMAVRSPPPEAFVRFPFRHGVVADEEISMTVLEDTPSTPRHCNPKISDLATPEVMDEVEVSMTNSPKVSSWQRVLVFQLALLSTILWIPSLYIPIFSVQYHGLASVFVVEPQKAFFLWNLASFHQELPSDDRFYNNILLNIVALSFLITIPLKCTCLSIVAWLGEGTWSTSSRRIIYSLQPAQGSGIVLLAALMIGLTTLNVGDSTQFCRHLFIETECFSVTGQVEVGAWLYALHTIVLELLVQCTLRWSCAS
ncbi:hypothetical protein MPSEU_000214200 [Mayamaea pseudoterrestris]|nr:hypothetical protein MPSEU_000214200 [Mayamaea pseudoterrestris]